MLYIENKATTRKVGVLKISMKYLPEYSEVWRDKCFKKDSSIHSFRLVNVYMELTSRNYVKIASDSSKTLNGLVK